MIRLIELDECLAGPDGHTYRGTLDTLLQQTALRLKSSLSRPLPRDECRATEACAQAVAAARGVLARAVSGASDFSSTSSGVARS